MRTKSVRWAARVRASSSAHSLLCPRHRPFSSAFSDASHSPQGPLAATVLCTGVFRYPWGERRGQHMDTAEFTGLCPPMKGTQTTKCWRYDVPSHTTHSKHEMVRRNQKNITSTVTTWACSVGGKVLEVRLVNVPSDEFCQQMIQRPRDHQPAETHGAAGWLVMRRLCIEYHPVVTL